MSRRSSTASRPRRSAVAAPGAPVLHLDAFSGIAGNMFLGALLDLGLSRAALERDLAGLGVGFRLKVATVRRGALGATYLDVGLPARRGPAVRGSGTARRGHHGRGYAEIRRTITAARLDAPVRSRALAIFEALARAEARIHRVPVEKVHFHELGAVDALVDVTGAAIGLHRLGIARITCSPVAIGHGEVETSHGRLPLPAPATLELLKNIPTVPAHVAWETVTPTGAALLRTLVDEYRALPAMRVEAIGYGAGNDRPGPMPNVLRAVLGRESGVGSDRVAVLETNLDDLVPEHFDWLMERLFEAGALDVSLQHLQMKKNRPGFGVRVIARPADRLELAQVLFSESTAIGVRTTEADRLVLFRETRRVSTPHGRIGVKVIRDGEGRIGFSAEYDDCKRAAKARRVALRDVIRAAEAAAREEWGDDGS